VQAGGDTDHAYAYVSDRNTRAAFARMKPVEMAVASMVRSFKAFGKNQLLGHAVRVGPRQFPRVHEIARHCAETLGIVAPTVYIVNQPTLNAMTAGTNDDSFILVHSALVDHLNDAELLDVIGHECGHIHNNHVVYLTTMQMLKQLSQTLPGKFAYPVIFGADRALDAWSRRAEITSDRAGLLCCKDLEVSTRSLAKLALGSHKLYEQLNLDEFVEQFHEGQDGPGRYMEAFSSHPWLPKRILALRAFAESALYRTHAGEGEGGLTMEEVDAKVHEIIKVVGLAMALEQFHERRHQVIRALTELSTVGGDIGAKSLGDRVEAEVIKKLEEDRFNLVVVGEFNHGKSTFVNALLGRTVLPTGVTPTTAVIHHLVPAPEPRAEVVYNSGEREPISMEALRNWAVGDDSHDRSAQVQYIEIGYPASLLEEGVVLVDTPGVNDLSLARADITYKYIPQSDAVLFLMDAGQMLKESERVFLVDKLIGKSRDKIVFVINKSDIWSPEEREEALFYVRQQLSKLVKDPVIFPLSAHDALAERASSGMPELIDHLSRFLANERGRIMLDHALVEGLAVSGWLDQTLDAKRHALRMTREELDRRIAIVGRDAEGQLLSIDQRRSAIREEVSAIKAWAGRDLQRFVDDVTRQIPDVVDNASSDDIRQHMASFLESTFRDWAQKETGEIAGALETLAEKTIALVKEDAKETGRRLGEALELKSPSVDVDRFVYDVGIVALFVGGLGTMIYGVFVAGGLMVLAAPVLALYVRDKVEAEMRKRVKEAAPQVLRDAAAKVGPQIDAMIDKFAEELDHWVVTTGKEMYRSMLEVLTAARTDRDKVASSDEASLAVLEEHAKRLGVVKGKLEKLRATVNAPPPEVVEAPPQDPLEQQLASLAASN
jgi:Zn-dependent protease with chaperone function/ribosome biogenesis GTPase A